MIYKNNLTELHHFNPNRIYFNYIWIFKIYDLEYIHSHFYRTMNMNIKKLFLEKVINIEDII